MSFMNTEKEILLNKDKIKSLEIKIKEKEFSSLPLATHFISKLILNTKTKKNSKQFGDGAARPALGHGKRLRPRSRRWAGRALDQSAARANRFCNVFSTIVAHGW